MRTSKKLVSAVLALCMIASSSIVTSFAAVADNEVGAGDYGVNTVYSQASEAIDNEYAYTKGDLGASYSPKSTTFKVWAPTATKVVLNRYATGSDDEEGAKDLGTLELTKLEEDGKWTGVWTGTVEGDIKNTYYTYTITAENTTGTATTTTETQDVYSVATGVNGKRSMVCDLDSTDPEGWENDKHVLLEQSTDSSVWEIHVKDFSYDPASGISEENRGKFTAFTETGTTLNGEGKISTGIDYLKELGITTVQITPFYDFESVNEAGDDSQFNWGYDPQNYNVPEGSYSTNPYDGNVRIKECKEMIQALHDAGISVVMDVVYNHTYSTNSCFQATVPNYYYRMTSSGTFSNGSGCGNECASERAMYRDYMIQSCLYWVNEYHVDGFRFDLMGILDVETMNMIRDALDQVDPRITMWGEAWTGGDSYHPVNTCSGTKYYPSIQSNAKMLNDRIAIFNDGIRDGIKGNCMNIANQGFVQGAKTSAKDISYGIRANTVGTNKWKANAPSQCITYAACHDNATLYDQILGSTGLADYGVRNADAVKMNKLAGAIVYTSQGISFTLAGEEMCRSKDGDTNSYKSPATLNMIKWQNVVDYADVISYYKGMMQIKSAFTPLTCMDNTYSSAFNFTNSLTTLSNQVSFTITNDQQGEWNKMAVLYNSASTEAEITLKDTEVTDWVILANNEAAGLDSLGEVQGSTFTVPAYSAIVAVDKAGYEAAGIKSNMGKVVVHYMYEPTDTKLDDSVVLQGTAGTGYQTSPSAGVPETYVVTKIEGDETGVYSEDTKDVTYYYTDYVPESLKNADVNNDGIVNVMDVSEIQKYVAGIISDDSVDTSKLDLNYDGAVTVEDASMLGKHLAEYPVSTGTITVNHYYTDENGEQQKLTASETITGRVGSEYSTKDFKVVGYGIDESKYPANASGVIPYSNSMEINYYYVPSSLDINLHFKHNGSLTWAPTLWIWGSDLNGVDKGNYTPDDSAVWPGVAATDEDGDGWYDYGFTYRGAGIYNVIVSNNGATQTIDYKGFVDNEMWVVINDAAVSGGTYLTFYTDNPDTNPDAPIASQVTIE